MAFSSSFAGVGFGLGRQLAQLGEGVGLALLGGESVGEQRDDAARQGDVFDFELHARGLGEGLEDGQQRLGGQGRGFVGQRVDDSGGVGHDGAGGRRLGSGEDCVSGRDYRGRGY